jgi:hypothetical protein
MIKLHEDFLYENPDTDSDHADRLIQRCSAVSQCQCPEVKTCEQNLVLSEKKGFARINVQKFCSKTYCREFLIKLNSIYNI